MTYCKCILGLDRWAVICPRSRFIVFGVRFIVVVSMTVPHLLLGLVSEGSELPLVSRLLQKLAVFNCQSYSQLKTI